MTKARPILMSAPMVRALLEGRKTQTRRICKPQPVISSCQQPMNEHLDAVAGAAYQQFTKCPYGQPGDLLWVRERFVHFDQQPPCTIYYADHEDDYKFCDEYRFTPSIHMPRWANRLTLEITDVRVERLQDCSPEDALAEGAEPDRPYGTIWKTINGQASWDANPWVWALTFNVHQQNVDDFLKARSA